MIIFDNPMNITWNVMGPSFGEKGAFKVPFEVPRFHLRSRIPDTFDQNTWWGTQIITWWGAHIQGGLASQPARWGKQLCDGLASQPARFWKELARPLGPGSGTLRQVFLEFVRLAGQAITYLLAPSGRLACQATMYLDSPPCIRGCDS